jgi:hypothetical protein
MRACESESIWPRWCARNHEVEYWLWHALHQDDLPSVVFLFEGNRLSGFLTRHRMHGFIVRMALDVGWINLSTLSA